MAELSELFVKISSKFDATGLDATVKKVEEAEKKIENVSEGFKIAGTALVGFATVGVVALNSLVKSIASAELEESKLTNALKQTGFYTEKTKQILNDYATEIQKTTKYNDEAVKSAETFLLQMSVTPDIMKKTLDATVDLASALKIDLQTASMLVGKAASGNTSLFARYGIVLDETKLKAGGFSYVLSELNKKFGGSAQAEVNTFSGKVEQLKNAFDDLQESLGSFILPTITKVVDMLKGMVDWFNNLNPTIKSIIANTLLWGTAIAGITGSIGLLLGFLPQVVTGITLVIGALKVLTWGNPYGIAIGLITTAVIGLATALGLVSKMTNDYQSQISVLNGKIANLKEAQSNLSKDNVKGFKELQKEIDILIKQRAELNGKLEEQKKIDEEIAKLKGKQTGLDKKLSDEALERERKYTESIIQFKRQQGLMTTEEYKKTIEEQLKLVKKGTDDEMALRLELYKTEQQLLEQNFVTGWFLALQKVYLMQTNWTNRSMQLIQAVQGGFETAFTDILTNGTEFFTAMTSVGNALKSALIQQISQIAAEWVIKTGIMKLATASWAAVEFLASQMVTAGKIIAGWATIPYVGIGLGITAAAGALAAMNSQFKFFAEGGLVNGTTPAIIGEAGPEMVLPLRSEKTTQLLSEAIDRSTTNVGGNNISINISDSIISNRQTLRQNADLIANEIMTKLKINTKVK